MEDIWSLPSSAAMTAPTALCDVASSCKDRHLWHPRTFLSSRHVRFSSRTGFIVGAHVLLGVGFHRGASVELLAQQFWGLLQIEFLHLRSKGISLFGLT